MERTEHDNDKQPSSDIERSEDALPVTASWTDPESGECLVLRLSGSEAFLTELEAVGFEPMSGICDVVSLDHTGGRSRVRSSAALSGDKSRAGSTHPPFDRNRESA